MKKMLTFLITIFSSTAFGQVEQNINQTDFLPEGFKVFEKTYGELNNDGVKDCVLIIKGTDKNQIITDQYRGQLDRNRRGIIVVLSKKDKYELAIKNYECFSSENEDGGAYFAPELSIEIKNGNLNVHYGHGGYGFWEYTFRFHNLDFELIGYDAGYRSKFASEWVTFDEESYNLLTKKKLIKEVVKVDKNGKETFKETWKHLNIKRLLKLSEINNFDELDITLFTAM